MFIVDLKSRVSVSTLQPSPSERLQLLQSPNAMSVFINPQGELPERCYMRITDGDQKFIGAAYVEPHENRNSRQVIVHMMLLERDRRMFTLATELTALLLFNQQFMPTARVLDHPYYHYMHEYLKQFGMIVKETLNNQTVYRFPLGWKSREVESFLVGDYSK